MTTTITVTPHNPNGEGVVVTIFGNYDPERRELVKNGETKEFTISEGEYYRATETNEGEGEEGRDGAITARSFNPDAHPVVEGVKDRVEELAHFINGAVPKCRRRSVALTSLETASMYAVKANFYPDN